MFGFGSSKNKVAPVAAQENNKLTRSVEKAILAVVGSHSIPTLPLTAQRAFSLAVDPNADVRDFIDVIESDEALSARVIKIANSVFFDRGNRSETIDQAVTVIGLNELRCLLNATTLSELFPSNHPLRAAFWAHDIAVALISREIARQSLPERAEVAFLGGLMHDIGKLLLLQRSGEVYAEIISKVEEHGIQFYEAEVEHFPFNHTEVGYLIGERWNFTPELLLVIRTHHDAWEAVLDGGKVLTLTAVIKCADFLAHALGLGSARSFIKLRNKTNEGLDLIWELLKVSVADRRSELARLRRVYDSEYELYAKQ